MFCILYFHGSRLDGLASLRSVCFIADFWYKMAFPFLCFDKKHLYLGLSQKMSKKCPKICVKKNVTTKCTHISNDILGLLSFGEL